MTGSIFTRTETHNLTKIAEGRGIKGEPTQHQLDQMRLAKLLLEFDFLQRSRGLRRVTAK